MANITTRQTAGTGATVKNAPLTSAEVDGNFLALNTELATKLNSETVTSLSINANVLTYTNENGDETDIDLSLYLDDTNLARIVSGNLAADGTATFTRSDNTTFQVDFSSLVDQTASEILTKIKTVDGTGSGLDADTLDGIEASAFATDAEVAVIKQDIYNTAAANYTLNGGGIVTVTNGTSLKWTRRVLAIPVERSEFGSSGYIDINCPTSGTITYYGNGSVGTITCDADGIELPTWSALYYQVTPGQVSSSDQTKFRVVDYQNSSWAPEEGWLLLAVRNSDPESDGITFLPNGGIKFPSGVVTATFDVDEGIPSWLATRDVATTSANGLMSSSDKTKLDGIETGATADQTASEILTAIKTVDGTGSGLDADLLDGNDASSFVSASGDTMTGNLRGTQATASQSWTVLERFFANPAAESGEQTDIRLINDLAGFNKWGTETLTNVVTSHQGSTARTTLTDAAYDGTSSTISLYKNANDDPNVILLELPHSLTYSCWVGVVFGAVNFRARSVKIETYRNGAWQTECDITNSPDHIVSRQVASNDGNGVTKIRYTFDDYNNTWNHYCRIHSLFAVNYRAGNNAKGGVHYIEKYKNSDHYGNIYPATDSTYTLGTSSNRYSNIYSDASNVAGNITVTGTVDGRDVATDGTKLDGIASSATANPNAIDNIIEDTTPQLGGTLDANGNSIDMGTNAITDTKVGQWDTAYGWGDHASAGYLTSYSYSETDTLDSVTDRGATTTNDVTVGKFTASTTNDGTWTKPLAALVTNLGNGQNAQFTFGKAVSGNNLVEFSHHHTSDGSSNNHMTIGYFGGTNRFALRADGRVSIGTAYNAPVFTSTFNVTGNISVTGFVDGRDVSADGWKLDGIETGATADQTASEILTAVKTVDGSGSGLDADKIDGYNVSVVSALPGTPDANTIYYIT